MTEYKDITELKKQIADFKKAIHSPNGDYLTGYVCALSATEGVIAGLPDADVVEVVHSFWDDSGRYVFPSGRKAICCDICKCALSVGEYNRFKWNYCPVCGAKMDGERKDNG